MTHYIKYNITHKNKTSKRGTWKENITWKSHATLPLVWHATQHTSNHLIYYLIHNSWHMICNLTKNITIYCVTPCKISDGMCDIWFMVYDSGFTLWHHSLIIQHICNIHLAVNQKPGNTQVWLTLYDLGFTNKIPDTTPIKPLNSPETTPRQLMKHLQNNPKTTPRQPQDNTKPTS